jgi:putative transcriptional regulator
MIHHHPADHHLLALASGQIDSGRGFVLSAHVDGCRTCGRRIRDFMGLGGEILATADPATLAPESFARTLQRIDATDPAPGVTGAPAGNVALPTPPAVFPDEAAKLLPSRLLQGCSGEPWRWIGPGVRYSSIAVPHAGRAKVFLLKISPGRTLPQHSHGGCEFTQVLSGSFDDGRARFAGGDFDETDPQVTHQPVVTDAAECICLAYLDSPLRFSSWLARAASRWTAFQDWRPA